MGFMDGVDAFWRMAGESLRFEYASGAVTHLSGVHSTGWRTLPNITVAQLPIGHAEIELRGSRVYQIPTHHCVLVPPGVEQIITMRSQEEISRWSHSNFYVFGSLNLASLIDLPVVVGGPNAVKIGDVNEELAEVAKQPASLKKTVAHQVLGLQLLGLLIEVSQPRAGSVESLQEAMRLAPVLSHIHQHLDASLDQEKLARMAHLSVSRFRAVFTRALNASPRDYIGALRIQRAQQLLIGTDLHVNEIAAQTGHDDPFHFSRIFRKKSGKSPSDYRQQARASML
jgi:AraC-like DNA-binding protein